MKSKRLFIAILVLFPWLSACANGVQAPRPPLNLPFAVQKAGSKLETELRIVEGRSYSFTLRFMYKENDHADFVRVRALAGSHKRDMTGKLIDPGVPILLKLVINQVDAQGSNLLFAREISEQALYSLGGDSHNKKIADIPLDAGYYRVSIESLRDVPELEGTKINFVIVTTYFGK